MAEHSWGATLKYSTDGGTNYTQLGDVKSITTPSMKAKSVDTTHLSSSDKARTFVQGMKDAGSVKAVLGYVKAEVTAVNGFFWENSESSATMKWKLTLPDTSTVVWDGFLEEYQHPNIPDDDSEVRQEITIKVSGKPVWTAAA